MTVNIEIRYNFIVSSCKVYLYRIALRIIRRHQICSELALSTRM